MAELNYEKLLADKKLEIGVAIGYEFNSEFADMVNFLKSGGFTLNAGHTKFYDIYSRRKMYQKKKTKTDPNPVSVEILIEVSIMYSGKDNPKSTFSDFLANKEVVLYSGHARAGHGPDFDGDDVTAQNFVIGDNSFYHRSGVLPKTPFYNHAQIPKTQQNDLEAMSRDKKFRSGTYRAWFFNACSSKNYLDEVRGVWKKNMFQGSLVRDEKGNRISNNNLLFFGTRHTIRTDALPLLKELVEFHSMDQIIKAMSAQEKAISERNKETFQNDTFFSN
jgi:hypothetical protein